MKAKCMLNDKAAIEAVAFETMRLLGQNDCDGAYSLLSRLSKPQLEKAAELIGMSGIYNTKSKPELLERVRGQLWAFTSSGKKMILHRRKQESLRYRINERLDWAIGNRAGYCGGPISVPWDASVEEKQAAYREVIDGYMKDLDDSPESDAIRAEVDEWWNSPITAGVHLAEVRSYLAEKQAAKGAVPAPLAPQCGREQGRSGEPRKAGGGKP